MPAVLEPGLPDIIGNFYARAYQSSPIVSGAFTATKMSTDTNQDSGNASNNSYSFKASNSNSIYGTSTTVQPPAICLIPQIKF